MKSQNLETLLVENEVKSSWNCVDWKEQWGTRIKCSLFLNFAFDCESRKSATSTYTTLPFESNSWQHWMSNVWTYILDNLCNLHTINVILAMNLMFKPLFLMPFFTFWQKIVIFAPAASCLFWSNFFTCWSKKQPNQNQNSSFNLKLCFTGKSIKILWTKK